MAATRELRVDVNGEDYIFADPGEARKAARTWTRMARELDQGDPSPLVQEKIRELRARAKAASDWARQTEDAGTGIGRTAATSDEAPSPSKSEGRRRAARTLATTGITRTRKAATSRAKRAARTTGKRAVGPSVAAGVSMGEFAMWFVGAFVLLTLFEDVITKTGSAGFSKAVGVSTQIADKVIKPVPLVAAH